MGDGMDEQLQQPSSVAAGAARAGACERLRLDCLGQTHRKRRPLDGQPISGQLRLGGVGGEMQRPPDAERGGKKLWQGPDEGMGDCGPMRAGAACRGRLQPLMKAHPLKLQSPPSGHDAGSAGQADADLGVCGRVFADEFHLRDHHGHRGAVPEAVLQRGVGYPKGIHHRSS